MSMQFSAIDATQSLHSQDIWDKIYK